MKQIKLLMNKIIKKYPLCDIKITREVWKINWKKKATDKYILFVYDHAYGSKLDISESDLSKQQLINRLNKILEG